MMETSLTFDDIALVPQYNNIPSRTEPSLETWLTKDVTMSLPLIPSNMESVISERLADIIVNNGGIVIYHRFCSEDEQLEMIKKYGKNMFISAGLNDKEMVDRLLQTDVRGVCIDVAHGHDIRVIEYIKYLKDRFPDKQVIAGNVCTQMGYTDLAMAGADGVKIGIGGGSCCSTRMVTGFGVPQFSAVRSCAKVARKLRVPIIADGGIRSSADIVKALAAGASSVMCGKIFAQTEESAGQQLDVACTEKIYRGQASREFQDDYRDGMKVGTVAEGVSMAIKVKGPAQNVIDDLLGGIRSGMTYGGARNIKELQRKAEFVRVVPSSYLIESNPRI